MLAMTSVIVIIHFKMCF